MYLQEILEVAVGLVFLWLVLSIATMQILEWGRSFTRRRAIHLQETIGNMLDDPALSDKFYNHPLIKGLSTGRKIKLPSYIPAQHFAMVLFEVVTTANTEASLIRKGLDDIRADLEKMENADKNQAAKDVLDSLIKAAQKAAATDAGSKVAEQAMEELNARIQTLTKDYPQFQQPIDDLMAGLEEEVKEFKDAAKKVRSKSDSLKQLQKGIVALGAISPRLNKTLNTLLSGLEEQAAPGEDAIAKARDNVANWFDSSMERLSGSFKRRTLIYSFIVGTALAIFMNVDSITVARYLWVEPAVRQVLIEKADNFELDLPKSETTEEAANQSTDADMDTSEPIEEPTDQPTDSDTEAAETSESPPESGSPNPPDQAAPADQEEAEVKDPAEAMQEFRAQFDGLSIPLGWNFTKIDLEAIDDENQQQCSFNPGEPDVDDTTIRQKVFGIRWNKKCYRPSDASENTNGWGWAGLKLLGIALSGLATVQGAPFWFDVLKRLVNVRGSGANPAERGQNQG
jgi:hypothetical protein